MLKLRERSSVVIDDVLLQCNCINHVLNSQVSVLLFVCRSNCERFLTVIHRDDGLLTSLCRVSASQLATPRDKLTTKLLYSSGIIFNRSLFHLQIAVPLCVECGGRVSPNTSSCASTDNGEISDITL